VYTNVNSTLAYLEWCVFDIVNISNILYTLLFLLHAFNVFVVFIRFTAERGSYAEMPNALLLIRPKEAKVPRSNGA